MFSALIEVLCTPWWRRSSCVRIWSPVGVQKTTNFLTSNLGMVQWAPALSHVYLSHSGFKGNRRHRDTESPGVLVPGPCVDEVGTLWLSMVHLVNLMRKFSHLISRINFMDVYWCHHCTKLPYDHRREITSLLEHDSSHSNAGARNQMNGFLSQNFFLHFW